jgi:RNA polymerase sigma-70 factor (ECF subfamily)
MSYVTCLSPEREDSATSVSADEEPPRAVQSDADWLREIYEQHRDALYGYVLTMTVNPAVAEDFVSETFVRAAKNVAQLRSRADSPRPWLFRVAQNIFLDERRSCYARKRIVIDHLPELPVEQDPPEDRLVRSWLAGEVRHCIRQLNAAQQQCLRLRFEAELSVTETAAAMNKSVNAIKQLQHRAIGKLGELLAVAGLAETGWAA